MHHFHYRNGRLHAEEVDLARLADEVRTPFYCYSTATLERHYRVFADAFAQDNALVCFAMKANSNQAVLATLGRLGAGMDIVSGGELARALAAGIDPQKIVFSGVGKTREEMAAALRAGILCFNVESEPELAQLSEVATSLGATAPVSVRVNPDVDALTHAKISTGTYENKFGIPITRAREVYARAAALPGLAVHGIDMHIGSQITDLTPFSNAAARLCGLARDWWPTGMPCSTSISAAARHPLSRRQRPSPGSGGTGGDAAPAFRPARPAAGLRDRPDDAGNAGILVTKVLYVKHGEGRTFVIVDGAMNDLIRPTLYDAFHALRPVDEPTADAPRLVADVVGPVCESGDYFAKGREMPEPKPGDLIAVMSAGAYGAVQAGTYNTRPLVPEVLVRGSEAAVVRPRQEVEALIALDRMPGWLG